jgi:hypothetical protein
MQGKVSMNQDGDHIIGLAIKTPLSLVRHHDHLDPALYDGTGSEAIASELVELNDFHDVACPPVHLKHTYPIKYKPDISVEISAA